MSALSPFLAIFTRAVLTIQSRGVANFDVFIPRLSGKPGDELTGILDPRKLFPRNVCECQSAKILRLENFALYGIYSSQKLERNINITYLRSRIVPRLERPGDDIYLRTRAVARLDCLL